MMASPLGDLIGKKVIKGKDESVDSSQFEGDEKVLGIYFSAHWCPPCRAFTPQLAQWYKQFKEGPNGDKLEIVFVSSDKDEEAFQEYFKEMPWYAVPFSDRDKKVYSCSSRQVCGCKNSDRVACSLAPFFLGEHTVVQMLKR